MLGLIKRLFGSSQSRRLFRYQQRLDKINEVFNALKDLNNDEWKEEVNNFRKLNSSEKGRLKEGQVNFAAALVKAASYRLLGKTHVVMGYPQKWEIVHYDEQIMAGLAMYYGNVTEMQTGEGKTLSAVLPLFLHSINGQSFSITVNDYLAQRDCEWMEPLFFSLQTTVSFIKNQQNPVDKKRAYSCNVVYGTASEFGFDYLRDHSSAYHKREVINTQGNNFALIDEIDHVLINESRVPLIISGVSGEPSSWFTDFRDSVESIYLENEELCKLIIDRAKYVFDSNGWLGERTEEHDKSLSSAIEESAKKVFLVSKSSPNNRTLFKMMEYANIRSLVDRWDVYFSYEHNKEELHELMQDVLIVRSEQGKDFELTERGLERWDEIRGNKESMFEMIDVHQKINDLKKSNEDEETINLKIAELQKKDLEMQDKASCLKSLFYAFVVMRADSDYIVENGEIVLIDEATGRLQYGRRFSHGIHQAIEAKERVQIQKDTKTIASITIQNFVKTFKYLAGMSGTAYNHEIEFFELYEMPVVIIPPHRPSNRIDLPDQIFVTKREKMNALSKEVQKIHATGRPILIGTYCIEESEEIHRILSDAKIPHKVLSAKNHQLEAEIISKAGLKNSVTIATNMAGRGTDIKLGIGVNELGGMHVIVSSRGKGRSQDLQFRGRQGRQGDRGSCQFFISFEDDILKNFQSPAMLYVLKNHRPPEGEVLSSPLLSQAISTAQERLEHAAYQSRKNLLDYESIINTQRTQIYDFRMNIIANKNPKSVVEDILMTSAKHVVDEYFNEVFNGDWKGGEEARKFIMDVTGINIEEGIFDNRHYSTSSLSYDLHKIIIREINAIDTRINKRLSSISKEIKFSVTDFVSTSILRKLDEIWRTYLDSIEEVKQYVQLRSIGQKDPIYEFRKESNILFDFARKEFDKGILKQIFRDLLLEEVRQENGLDDIRKMFESSKANQKLVYADNTTK